MATAALGALTIALAGLHRLSAHTNLIAAPFWFWRYRANPLVQRWTAIGGLSVLTCASGLAMGVISGLRRPLFGAARWARESDIRAAGMRTKKGLILGRKAGRILSFGGPEHVLVYAPTRSGKGVGVVIPNLLNWPDSVVVLDIKRENWLATAGFRAAHGQKTILFDPLDPQRRTARYNPLGHIDRTDATLVLDELQKIAAMLFPMPTHADPFWAEAARTGFIGVGALIAATPERPFSLGEVYRVLTQSGARDQLPARMQALQAEGRALSGGCISAVNDFCSASENTFASIKQTITARMNLWLNPNVDAATDVSDFDLTRLRQDRISLYLGVSPDNLTRVAPLYNLLFQQLIDHNARTLPRPEDHEVLVLLDEFARLGVANVLAQSFSYIAGYRLRLMPVIQSPAQLRALYGADIAEEIISNCGVEVVFAPKELKVAQELSERLGFYTYEGRALSRPSGLSTGRRSQTQSDQRRALMLPQELIQLPRHQLIVLRAGMAPIRGEKITYHRDRAFLRRVQPAPGFSAAPLAPPLDPPSNEAQTSKPASQAVLSDLVLDALTVDPLPPKPSEAEVADWVDRYLDRMASEGGR